MERQLRYIDVDTSAQGAASTVGRSANLLLGKSEDYERDTRKKLTAVIFTH